MYKTWWYYNKFDSTKSLGYVNDVSKYHNAGILRCHVYTSKMAWNKAVFYLPLSFAFTWTSLYRVLNTLALVATLAMNITVIYHMLMISSCCVLASMVYRKCLIYVMFLGKNILWNIMLARLLPFVMVNPAETPSEFHALTESATLGNICEILGEYPLFFYDQLRRYQIQKAHMHKFCE